MSPSSLYKSLITYQEFWFERLGNPFGEDSQIVEHFLSLVSHAKNPFSRKELPGHFTGSCFIVNPLGTQVLLLKHRKLIKWLQPGGHCDGDSNTARVAMKEAQEESGSSHLRLLNWSSDSNAESTSPLIVDLDIHSIPANQKEPAHSHYDVRYFAVCDHPDQLQMAELECSDLRWFEWKAAFDISPELSMHRSFNKFSFLSKMFPQALSLTAQTT